MEFIHQLKTAIDDPKTLGRLAETLTIGLLKKQRLRFLARNFHARHGEIDLIMHNQTTVVFIEVKARAKSAALSGLLSITPNKQRKIRQTAEVFLLKYPQWQAFACRFDVVNVVNHGMILSFEWRQNTF